MKRRVILLIGLLLAAAIALIIAIRRSPADAYRYQAKTIHQWLEELLYTTNSRAASLAFTKMGTNADLGLLQELKRNETWRDRTYARIYPGFPTWLKRRCRQPFPQTEISRAAARLLIHYCNDPNNAHRYIFPGMVEILGNKSCDARFIVFSDMLFIATPLEKDSVPALTKLTHDPDLDTRTMAAVLLLNIDGQTNAAVAALRAAMSSQKPSYMKQWAPVYLFNVNNPHDESLIPLFIADLQSTNLDLQREALSLLAVYGPSAVGAVPALTNLTNSPDPELRSRALDALRSITRQNAVKFQFRPAITK